MSLAQVLTFLLVLARVSAFVAVFPLFGRREIPMAVKAGLAMSLSFFWFFSLGKLSVPEGILAADVDSLMVSGWIMREVAIGILLGITTGLLLVPARVAGAYVGQELGLTLAATASPNGPDSVGEVTQLFEAFSVLAFFALNLHHFVILMVHASFDQLAGQIDIWNLPMESLTALLGNLDKYGLMVIAPVAICMFILNLAMVLLNKVAPNLNLFSIGMTLRGTVGLLCVFVFFPIIMRAMGMYFERVQFDLMNVYAWYQK